jgi:hypothetical protein
MNKDLFWTSENASTLSLLRTEKGLDAFQVARMANLSAQHVNELESLKKLLLLIRNQGSNGPPPSGFIEKVI